MITIIQKRILLFIIFGAFGISLIHSFYFRIQPIVDARAYDNIATNLASGKGYLEDASAPKEKDAAIARVGPGYELFLAGVYKIFGHHYKIIWFFQAIFLALIAFLTFLISKQIFKNSWNPAIGCLSAAIAGFSPDLIVVSSMLLTEILGILLMLLSVYFFFRYFESKKWTDLILLAIFFTFSVLVRSQLAPLGLIFLILFVARREWLKMIFFFLIVVLLFSPWILRNYGKYGILMPFNAALGYNLWNGNHLGASGEMEINYQPLIDYAKDHTSIETHQKGIEEFKNFILHYPLGFAKITLKRISIFFSFSRPSGFWPDFTPKQQAVSAFLSLIYSVIIFTLGIAGAVLSLKNFLGEEKKKIRLFAALAICIPVSVIFILVESRYRYPLYPFLAVFGGFFVSEIISNKEKIKGLIIPFVVLFLNSILDFSLNFTRFWDKIKDIL